MRKFYHHFLLTYPQQHRHYFTTHRRLSDEFALLLHDDVSQLKECVSEFLHFDLLAYESFNLFEFASLLFCYFCDQYTAVFPVLQPIISIDDTILFSSSYSYFFNCVFFLQKVKTIENFSILLVDYSFSSSFGRRSSSSPINYRKKCELPRTSRFHCQRRVIATEADLLVLTTRYFLFCFMCVYFWLG